MQPLESIRGIYFDLWNTLCFTESSPHPILALAAAFELQAEPGWRKVIERAIMTRHLAGIGDAINALGAATGRRISGGWSRREVIRMWGESSNRNRLYPDVLPVLRALRAPTAGRSRYKLGILSNTQSFDLDFMRSEGLETFMDEICLSCDCGLLKPDPEIYWHAAGRMGLPPQQVVLVGDSFTDDFEGAKRAGLEAILLDRHASRSGSIQTLAELPGRIISASCP